MTFIDEDTGTCACGHEFDPSAQACIVWDSKGVKHLVPIWPGGACECHDIPVGELEHREW